MRQIGIIGGMGNEAMVDLVEKIALNPRHRDCEYVAFGNARLAYKPEEVGVNWGPTDLPELRKHDTAKYTLHLMQHLGVSVLGLACNSAHELFRTLLDDIDVPFVDMIHATAASQENSRERILVMGVTSLVASGLYQTALEAQGIGAFAPNESNQAKIMDAIYNTEFGIKTAQITERAEALLCEVIREETQLKACTKIVLGCTELPLALTPHSVARFKALGMLPEDIEVIDASMVLANALQNAAGYNAPLAKPLSRYRGEHCDWLAPLAIEVDDLMALADLQKRIFKLTEQYLARQGETIRGSYSHLPTLFFTKNAEGVADKLTELGIRVYGQNELTDNDVFSALATMK